MKQDDDFEQRDHPPWREGVKRFVAAAFSFGEVVPHKWFWDAVSMAMPDPAIPIVPPEFERIRLRFLKQFDALRQELLIEHSIHLENEMGEGYRVLPPNEQAEAAQKYCLSTVRKTLRRTVDRLHHSNLDALTAQERANHMAIVNQTVILAQSYKQVRKMPSLGTKPPELEAAG